MARMLGKVAHTNGNCGYGCCPVWNPDSKRERKRSRREQRARERRTWQRDNAY